MIDKGSMMPVKKVLGVILMVAGLGLVLFPDMTVNILCSQKAIFGIVVATAGYFLLISGRRFKK